mgnify:FL=1
MSPDLFANISELVLKEMEYSKGSLHSAFINILHQTISNELVLPIARFQALFYLKLATERTNMTLLKLIASHQSLLDTLQQQSLYNKTLSITSRGNTFFNEKPNEALSLLGRNYIRLLLEMINFWDSQYGNMTELQDSKGLNTFRQIINTLKFTHRLDFPQDNIFYTMFDRKKMTQANSRTILSQLSLSSSRLKIIREKLEELIKYITTLKEDYAVLKHNSTTIKVVALTGKYARMKTLSRDLQALADEARYIPEKDAPALLNELYINLEEAEQMQNDYNLFFTQKITAKEHISNIVSSLENGTLSEIINDKCVLECENMNLKEKPYHMQEIMEHSTKIQRQSNMKTLTFFPSASMGSDGSTKTDLDRRSTQKIYKGSKGSIVNSWLQENYHSLQLVPRQETVNRLLDKQNQPDLRTYSARKKGTGQSFSVKIMTMRTNEQYDRTCASLVSMMRVQGHKHVIEIKDYCFDSSRLEIGYAVPLGMNLEHVLDDDEALRQFNQRRVVEIFKDLVESLSYAQESNVHHLNIKPSNVIEVGGRFKLCDWGLPWQFLDLNTPGKKLVVERVRDGIYCAPELLTDQLVEIDAEKLDVYSLGVVMLRFLKADLLRLEDLDKHEEKVYDKGISDIIDELEASIILKNLLKRMLKWKLQERISLGELEDLLNDVRDEL